MKPLWIYLRALLVALLVASAAPATASPFSMRHGKTVSNAYPAAVLAADALQGGTFMRTVWDFHTGGVGSRVARGSMSAGATFSYPSGIAYLTHAGGSGDAHASLNVTANTNSLNAIDFNAGLYVTGVGTSLTVTDAYLSNNTGSTTEILGNTNGGGAPTTSATFVANWTTIDQAGVLHARSDTIGNVDGTASTNSATYAHDLFLAAPGDIMIMNGPLVISDSFLSGLGQNPNSTATGTYPSCVGVDAHVEGVKFDGGTVAISRTLFDPSAQSLDFCKVGITGELFWDPSGSGAGASTVHSDGAGNLSKSAGADVVGTLDKVIIHAAAFLNNSPYTQQSKCVAGYNSTVTYTNSILEKGTAGYNTNVNQGYIALTSVVGSFTAGETVQDGSMQAAVISWTPATGLLIISPKPNVASPWAGSFTAGHTLSGLSSSATATIGQSILNTCQVIAGAGNFDWATALPITTGALN